MDQQNLNPTPDAPSSPTPASDTKPKKTMTPAALAANRANARRSTGPRTPAGKARSASNSIKHGLYGLHNYEGFIQDNDMALEVSSNVMAQFAPITPTEHFLAQQLIHQQLRFLQMQFLYDAAFAKDAYALLTDPSPGLSIIMRELDRLPARIQRTIKALHAELALRVANEELEIEPIADLPALPKSSRPAPPEDNDPENRHYTQEQGKIAAKMLFSLFARRVLGVNPETGAKLTPQPNSEPQSPDPKAA